MEKTFKFTPEEFRTSVKIIQYLRTAIGSSLEITMNRKFENISTKPSLPGMSIATYLASTPSSHRCKPHKLPSTRLVSTAME